MYKNAELYHHGVLGMKWGVRRQQKSGGPRSKKRTMSDDAKEVAVLKKKSAKELSNAELKKANERLELERKYKQLNPNTIKKGMLYVTAATGIIGTTTKFLEKSGTLAKLIKSAKTALF